VYKVLPYRKVRLKCDLCPELGIILKTTLSPQLDSHPRMTSNLHRFTRDDFSGKAVSNTDHLHTEQLMPE
jgi:hypothetical protein